MIVCANRQSNQLERVDRSNSSDLRAPHRSSFWRCQLAMWRKLCVHMQRARMGSCPSFWRTRLTQHAQFPWKKTQATVQFGRQRRVPCEDCKMQRPHYAYIKPDGRNPRDGRRLWCAKCAAAHHATCASFRACQVGSCGTKSAGESFEGRATMRDA